MSAQAFTSPQGAMWKKLDRNKQVYYLIQIDMGEDRYSFNAFANKYKTKDTQPDFRIFPLDGGEPRKIEKKFTPKPQPVATEEPDEPMEDDGIQPEKPEEDDDLPF
jgi:hypothetical protein